MTDNDTVATAAESVNRFELIATYLGSTPEKVAALLNAVAVNSVFSVDYLTETVSDALATL